MQTQTDQTSETVLRVWRDGETTTGVVHTNIPTYARHHSPSGFNYGYGGSGPADLALNVLHHALLTSGYKGSLTAPLWDGHQVFRLAWALHQDFKDSFVARVSAEIPRWQMSWVTIRTWIDQNRPEGFEDNDDSYFD